MCGRLLPTDQMAQIEHEMFSNLVTAINKKHAPSAVCVHRQGGRDEERGGNLFQVIFSDGIAATTSTLHVCGISLNAEQCRK